jgi:hypothetical protein
LLALGRDLKTTAAELHRVVSVQEHLAQERADPGLEDKARQTRELLIDFETTMASPQDAGSGR